MASILYDTHMVYSVVVAEASHDHLASAWLNATGVEWCQFWAGTKEMYFSIFIQIILKCCAYPFKNDIDLYQIKWTRNKYLNLNSCNIYSYKSQNVTQYMFIQRMIMIRISM